FLYSRPPLYSTLFPYTTLFRSRWWASVKKLPATGPLALGQDWLQVGEQPESEAQQATIYEGLWGLRPWRKGPFNFFGTEVETERSEEHTSELQSRFDLVCRLLL